MERQVYDMFLEWTKDMFKDDDILLNAFELPAIFMRSHGTFSTTLEK